MKKLILIIALTSVFVIAEALPSTTCSLGYSYPSNREVYVSGIGWVEQIGSCRQKTCVTTETVYGVPYIVNVSSSEECNWGSLPVLD